MVLCALVSSQNCYILYAFIGGAGNQPILLHKWMGCQDFSWTNGGSLGLKISWLSCLFRSASVCHQSIYVLCLWLIWMFCSMLVPRQSVLWNSAKRHSASWRSWKQTLSIGARGITILCLKALSTTILCIDNTQQSNNQYWDTQHNDTQHKNIQHANTQHNNRRGTHFMLKVKVLKLSLLG